MMGEEGAVIGGLLVGLNVIDCNICIKGGDLDVQVCFTKVDSRHSEDITLRPFSIAVVLPARAERTCFNFCYRCLI